MFGRTCRVEMLVERTKLGDERIAKMKNTSLCNYRRRHQELQPCYTLLHLQQAMSNDWHHMKTKYPDHMDLMCQKVSYPYERVDVISDSEQIGSLAQATPYPSFNQAHATMGMIS